MPPMSATPSRFAMPGPRQPRGSSSDRSAPARSSTRCGTIAGIGAELLGAAAVAALLHQVALAQGLCAPRSTKRGGA